MNRYATHCLLTVLCAAVLPVAAATLPVKDFGGGATANIEFWSNENCWVGNPNVLNRNDRVLFNFDLTRQLYAGKVTRAVLRISAAPLGIIDENRIAVERFVTERPVIANIDLLSQETEELAQFPVTAGTPVPTWEIDVTGAVNRILDSGEGTVAFRIRNLTTETRGNRNSAAEGVSVAPAGIQLEVTP